MKIILGRLFMLGGTFLCLTILFHSTITSAHPQGGFSPPSTLPSTVLSPLAVSPLHNAAPSAPLELNTIKNGTLKAWPSRPFARPIPAPEPWWCVLQFEDLGSTDGTFEQTTGTLKNIIVEIGNLRERRPSSVAFGFSDTRYGVHLELRMVEPSALTVEVVIGALQVLYHQVRIDGARNVSPKIECAGVLCGRLSISFVDSGQGAALTSLPSNMGLTVPDLTA